MLGKIYRPQKVSSLFTKRGIKFYHKYKSNFGGIHHFNMSVYLQHEISKYLGEIETIRIEVKDLTIPVVLTENEYILESWDEAMSKVDKKRVSSPRVLERPAKQQISATGVQLALEFSIRSEEECENEQFGIILRAVVINNQEYIWIKTNSDTQVHIEVNTTIKLIAL